MINAHYTVHTHIGKLGIGVKLNYTGNGHQEIHTLCHYDYFYTLIRLYKHILVEIQPIKS